MRESGAVTECGDHVTHKLCNDGVWGHVTHEL